jgi:hypothetical protein
MITSEIEANAWDFLHSKGLVLDFIEWDADIKRCGIEGKSKGKDGAYIAHSDAPVSVWWQNHRTGETSTWTKL